MASFSYLILFSRTKNLITEPGVAGVDKPLRRQEALQEPYIQYGNCIRIRCGLGVCVCKAIPSAVTGHGSSHTPQCSVCLWALSE